jgi:hypothetical protein
MDVYRNLLLAFAAMTIERIEQLSAGELHGRDVGPGRSHQWFLTRALIERTNSEISRRRAIASAV